MNSSCHLHLPFHNLHSHRVFDTRDCLLLHPFIHSFFPFSFYSTCIYGWLLCVGHSSRCSDRAVSRAYRLPSGSVQCSREPISDTSVPRCDKCYEKGRHVSALRVQIKAQEKENSELSCDSEPDNKHCRKNSRFGGQDSPNMTNAQGQGAWW